MSGGLRLLFYDPIFEDLLSEKKKRKDSVHSALVEVKKNFRINSESISASVDMLP